MTAALLLGCGPAAPDPNAQGSETTAVSTEAGSGTSPETSTETGSGTKTGSGTETGPSTETGAPPCDFADCDHCAWKYDECGQPKVPACTDAGGCECVQAVPCPPCIERECGPWEACNGPTGTCQVTCEGELTPVIDPPGSCEIPLPYFLQPGLIQLEIDAIGISMSNDNDCASAPQGYIWLFDSDAIQLCEQACLAFEAAETVSLTWLLNCE